MRLITTAANQSAKSRYFHCASYNCGLQCWYLHWYRCPSPPAKNICQSYGVKWRSNFYIIIEVYENVSRTFNNRVISDCHRIAGLAAALPVANAMSPELQRLFAVTAFIYFFFAV